MPEKSKSSKVTHELYETLLAIPRPLESEEDAIKSFKVIQSLFKMKFIYSDFCLRLQDILFFIPQGVYREIYWPRLWVESSRL